MEKIYELYFQEILELNPSFATSIGEFRYNNKLENTLSDEYKLKHFKIISKYNKILDEIDNKKMNKKFKLFNLALRDNLNLDLEYYIYPFDLLPLNSQDNLIFDIVSDTKEGLYPLKKTKDFENLIDRYSLIPKIINTILLKLREGKLRRIMVPKIIISVIIDQLEFFINAFEIYKINNNILLEVEKEKKNQLMRIYKNVIQKIKYSYKKLLIFLKDDYKNMAPTKIGLSSYGEIGKNMYLYCIKRHTTFENITPEKIHRIGIIEVNRINKRMNYVIKEIKKKKKKELEKKSFKKMLKDKSFFFENGKDLINHYKNRKNIIKNSIIDQNFDFNISTDYDIREMPKFVAKNGPGAYYMQPSMDKKRKGIFFLNTYDLENNPKYSSESLCLHEGNPGHHWQITRSIDLNLPKFIIFSDNTAYFEGWALYCEGLGEYKDLFSLYGRLVDEMMRAVRLVVDTGIHYYDWSYEKALNYFIKYTRMNKSESENEIKRYISLPGQALAYKIGEKYILKLRDEFFYNNLGDIKKFHNFILNKGPIPLKLIKLDELKKKKF